MSAPSAPPSGSALAPDGLSFHAPAPPGGIAVGVASRSALLDDLGARLAAGRGFTLATLNLDHLVKLRADDAFRTAYAAHGHVVADGNPVVWLHRLAGRAVELIPGSELVAPLAAAAAAAGAPVALLGSTRDVLDAAAARLEADHPGLRVAVRIAPPMGFDPEGPGADDAIAALGAASASGLCFLALGAPRQERFAARAASRLPGWGFASVGAGIDFVAGHQVRAPVWTRRIAMEWAWRLGRDPRRLGARYAACFAVLPGLAARARAARRG
ncbi:WecB/TagA/CpsF family glycosyltransferase [Jannaschia sp. LMIT008]|uniref:WecB/TagA/CpsF family glycosyltransferase n=1 Tax=Jannaschia maritima TaxID=3032585 RepID=UPI0028125EBE|nr:WecB/TagA/CpsF family glycosyltransferase [Jannaschia sp. LMIT008]